MLFLTLEGEMLLFSGRCRRFLAMTGLNVGICWNIKHLSNNHICDFSAGFATFAWKMVRKTKMDFMEDAIKVKDSYYGSTTPEV